MAEDIKTTLQFQANIGDFKAAMQEARRGIKLANSEFAEASSGMDDWSKSTDGVSAKLKQLKNIEAAQGRQLEVLENAYNKTVALQGENSAAAIDLKTQINNQKAAINKTRKEFDKFSGDLDETENNLEDVDDASEEAGKGLGALGTIAGGVVKGIAAVGAAVGGVITAFFSTAESTRDYRREMAQLQQNATDTNRSMHDVKDVLSNVSAVTGETDAAMEGLNMLMATGLDTNNLTMAAEAFAGAATKFDGLKFEGLAEGLQESLAVGEAVGPFAELIERTGGDLEAFNKGLAGCSDEAARQQYVMKWLADSGLQDVHDAYVTNNADMVEAEKAQFRLNDAMASLGAIAEPVMTVLKNMGADLLESITPFVALIGEGLTAALNGSGTASATLSAGISGLLETALAKVTETIPLLLEVITTVLPNVLTTITEALPMIVEAIVQVVPQLLTALLELLPTLLESLLSIVSTIITGLAEMLPSVVAAIVEVIPQLITALLDNLPVLLEAAITLLMAIVDAIPTIVESLTEALPDIIDAILTAFTDNFDLILDGAVALLLAIVDAIPDIVDALSESLPDIITTILTGLADALPDLIIAAGDVFGTLLDAAGDLILDLPDMMLDIAGAIIDGITDALPDIGAAAADIFDAIWDTISELPEDMLNLGADIIEGLWNGISDMADWIKEKIAGFGEGVLGALKNFFGIKSPSRLMRDEVGKYIGLGIADGIVRSREAVQNAVGQLGEATVDGLSSNAAVTSGAVQGGKSISFTQNNYSPRALSRREIYRQTHNALAFAGGV